MTLSRKVHLTPRQQQIVQLLWAGETAPQIAQRLQISQGTVDAHRRMINAKYGTHNIAQLLRALLLDGVIR